MSFYKIIKIMILLGTGVLVACSPEKSDSSLENSTIKNSAPVKNSNDASSNAPGLIVNIDPVTGEFLSESPIDTNTIQTNSVQSMPKYSDMKESTTPGGGTYIEAIGVKKKNSK